MKLLIIMAVVLVVAGCGDGSGPCEGVDTSRAPDSILHGPAGTTYTWGKCSKTYAN
jgi:hypothetical protein